MPAAWSDYWIPFAGGLLVLAAWIGWGWALHRLLRLRTPLDWALAGTWGIAVCIAITGPLLLLHAADATALLVITLFGAAFFSGEITLRARRLIRHRRAAPTLIAPRSRTWFWHLPMILLLTIAYAGSINWRGINFPDDLPAYFVFIKRILQTGTLLEPMSFRRLSTYGGHHVLQAMVVQFGDLRNASIVDIGLAPILLGGNLYFMLRRHSTFQWLIVFTATFVFLLSPIHRVNSQSEASGLILFLALFRTLRFDRTGAMPRRYALVEGLLAAAVTTMRIHYIAAVGALFVFLAFGRWLAGRQDRALILKRFAIGMGVFLILLLPWAMLLYASSNSPLYPLFLGNQHPAYAILGMPLTIVQKLDWLLLILGQPPFLILIVPLVLLCRRRYLRSVLPLYGALVLASMLTVLSFPNSNANNLYRYCFPMLFAATVGTIAIALRQPRRSVWFIIAGALLLALLGLNFRDGRDYYDTLQKSAWDGIFKPAPFAAPAAIANYTAAQDAVPRAAAFFAATALPPLFDYRRNPIFNADMPGAASLPPGMPLAQGPAAVEAYLTSHGIAYIVLDDFKTDPFLYNFAFWIGVMEHPETNPPTFIVAAPFTIRFLQDMSALETPDRIVGRYGDLTVLHLHS